MSLRCSIFFVLLLFCNSFICSGHENHGLFKRLSNVILDAKLYDGQKLLRIQNIKKNYERIQTPTSNQQYEFYQTLYDEYMFFIFDTAYVYAKKMHELASKVGDKSKITLSSINLFFAFVSAGMTLEAEGILPEIDISDEPDSVKAKYYHIKARYYYDLAGHVTGNIRDSYYKMAIEWMDSIVIFSLPTSFEHVYFKGFTRLLRNENLQECFAYFTGMLTRADFNYHQQAITYATLGGVNYKMGNKNGNIRCQIEASICDIKSSTKEELAMINLAELLFQEGDYDNAAFYLKKAAENANFFGSRLRKIQISNLLPIIENTRIRLVESQWRQWILYGALVSAILFLVIILVIIFSIQSKKIKQTWQAAADINDRSNKIIFRLQKANSALTESSKMKEMFLSFIIKSNSKMQQRIDELKISVQQMVGSSNLSGIQTVVSNISVDSERQEFLLQFDKNFIQLFPQFLSELNTVLGRESQPMAKELFALNTEQRICALVRLGIKDNKRIAQILNQPMHTINEFNMTVSGKSVITEEFEKKLFAIKSA